MGYVASLACEDIREVLEEHLRDAYRRRDSRCISLPLNKLERPAIVFTEEHGQCLLIGGPHTMREP
ncbi:MAG TPA: hypothetical protein VFX59_01820, partial [Polyangiales bacterium]|nr:hypothetical protein [Polyangiales bacterium]